MGGDVMKNALALTMVVMICALAHADEGEAKGTEKLPFTVSKETTGITSPLHEDGTPDYVGAMNEETRRGVTAKENAFVAWLKVIGTGEVPAGVRGRVLTMSGAEDVEMEAGTRWKSLHQYLTDGGTKEETLQKLLTDENKVIDCLWTEKEYPWMAGYLKFEEAYLDATKEAFSRPRYWSPFVPGDGRSLESVVLPAISRMRAAANGLLERATLEAKAGDFTGFLSDVTAAKRMARHMGSQPTVIECMVGRSIESTADRATSAAAGAGIFSVEQCREVVKAMDGMGAMPTLERGLKFERYFVLDCAILLATGRRSMLQYTLGAPWGKVDLESVDWDQVLKRVNTAYEEMAKATKIDSAVEMVEVVEGLEKKRMEGFKEEELELAKRSGETRESYSQRVAEALLAKAMPTLGRMERIRREGVMRDAMARAVLAAAAYRAERGAWPGQLRDVVPVYLKEVPRDIYSEGGKGEVVLTVSEAGAMVSSVGPKTGDSRRAIEVGVK
jgi:hypothetical protein